MRDTTTTNHDVLAALALLHVPHPDRLTDRQRAGSACVFSGIPLTVTGATDLGPRATTTRHGDPVSWYPRAHRGEIPRAALAALHAHAPGCAPCRDRATLDDCPTGAALRRLMKEYR
ncbi:MULTISPECIES: hypothetical protein [Streptomyces]|uniref:Uncharacterized protein n=1 Tax=Streptomyces doudnae TaxID=3075536 RepID=A0ABD5EL66_9ACTN|nr:MULTISPECIES: hypothetical protein [unclassified Streptomyces]MDT0435033.1 hypothetical protein [Streptomyces sp. DSM 41981]MYQ67800.1 hypothetical protein [Streptomyces sp. SID4950]SCE40059.1 hypothetical protein GA0115242_135751 [Streptomyces sp. SolWspMP-5a-2]